MLYAHTTFEVGAIKALNPREHGPSDRFLQVRVVVSSDDLPEGQRSIVVERSWRFWRAPLGA
jgi:hypothetical protein